MFLITIRVKITNSGYTERKLELKFAVSVHE